MSGRVATLGLQLVAFSLLLRALGQARFGDLSAAIAAISVFAAIAELGLTSTLVVRFGQGDAPRQLLRTGLVASAATCSIGLAVILPSTYFVFSSHERQAVWLLLPSSLVEISGVAVYAYWQQRRSFVRLAIGFAIGQAIATVGIATIFLAGRHWSETGQLVVAGASMLCGAAAVVALLVLACPERRPRQASRFRQQSTGQVRSILRDAGPVGLAGAISLLHVRADQIVLAAFGYRRGLASYAVAYQLLQGAIVGLGSVGFVGFGLMASGDRRERALHSRRAVVLLCAFGTVGSFAMALIAPVAVGLLGAEHYRGAVRACRLLAPVVMLSVANTMAGRVLVVERLGRLLAGVAALALALNVALCVVLIPRLGIAGAATATVISEAIGAALVIVVAARRLPGSQPVTLLSSAILGSSATLLVLDWVSDSLPIAIVLGALTTALVGCLARSTWKALPSTSDLPVPQSAN